MEKRWRATSSLFKACRLSVAIRSPYAPPPDPLDFRRVFLYDMLSADVQIGICRRITETIVSINGIDYEVIKLLGHGKGGYSYLAMSCGNKVVLKQIHHEPCNSWVSVSYRVVAPRIH